MRGIAGILLIIVLVPSCSVAADLVWDASTSAEVTGYKIHYGTDSGNYPYVVDVGAVRTYAISAAVFMPGITYYVVASAYSPSELSAYSNEVTVRLPTQPEGVTLTFRVTP